MSNAPYEQLKKRYQLLIDEAKEKHVVAVELLLAFRSAFRPLLITPDAPNDIPSFLFLEQVVLSDILAEQNPDLVALAHGWLNARGVPSVYGGVAVDTDLGQDGDLRAVWENTFKDIKSGPQINFEEHPRLRRRLAVVMQKNPELLDAFREERDWGAVLEITATSVRVLGPDELQIRVSPAFYIIDEIHRNLDDVGVPPEFALATAKDVVDPPRLAVDIPNRHIGTMRLSPTNVELTDVYQSLKRTRDFVTTSYKTTMGMLDELDAKICAAMGRIEARVPNSTYDTVCVRVVDSATGNSWWVEHGEFFKEPRITSTADANEFTRYLGEQIWPFDNSDGWVVLVNKSGDRGHVGVFMSGRADLHEIAKIKPTIEGLVDIRAYVYATDAANRVQWVGMQYGDDELSLNHSHLLATPFSIRAEADYTDMAKSVLELDKPGLTFSYVFTKDWV